MIARKAILLLGPTGAGKTPLGELLAARGLWGRRCFHFDFGENLRSVAQGGKLASKLTQAERDVVARSLTTGALLENEQFAIARKILLSFLAERRATSDDLVVLNGLPRHAGQAADIDAVLTVEAVVSLACTPEVVLERIRTDAGGDRANRRDDDIEAVKRKLQIFAERTAGLTEHYRQFGAEIHQLNVRAETTAEDLWRALDRGV